MSQDKSPVKVEEINVDLENQKDSLPANGSKLLENPWVLRPTTQTILEGGLKHGTLSPCLHLGLFVGGFYVKTGDPDFSKDWLGLAACQSASQDYKSTRDLLMLFHIIGFLVQTLDLLLKGFLRNNSPRMLSITTFLYSLFIIAWHFCICLLLKRIFLYPEAVEVCRIYHGSDQVEQMYFGETKNYFQIEAMILMGQIFSMPLWVLRSKMSKVQEVGEDSYYRVLCLIQDNNTKKLWSDKVQITLLNNKYELDIWPSGLTIKNDVAYFKNYDLKGISAKEWIQAWTKLHAGAIEKFITQQFNHLDIVELQALKVQSFTLNFVQLFVTCVIIADEFIQERDQKHQWALWMMFGAAINYSFYLMYNGRQSNNIATVINFFNEFAVFIVLFVLLGNTKVFGQSDKPYIVKWSIINSIVIFVQTLHLKLLVNREKGLLDRILVGALYNAQINNEGLKSQALQPQEPIEKPPVEMKFDTQEVELPELRMIAAGSQRKSTPKHVKSGTKEKEDMFEGSEDIQMSNYDENMVTLNGSARSKVSSNLDKEGPRLGKDQMGSPKKVSNKRNIQSSSYAHKNIEKSDFENKENMMKKDLPEFPRYDPDDTANKIAIIDEQKLEIDSNADKKNTHKRGFSFNPSPRSVLNQQDKALKVDEDDNLNEGGEPTGYAELEQTTQNNVVDQSNNFIHKIDDSQARKSKSMGAIINESPRVVDTHRNLIYREREPTDISVNFVKKYNRQLRKIENGDGKTYDLAGDLYTYSVVMMMNPNIQQNHQQSMAQTCLITGVMQIFVFVIYFLKEGSPVTIEPVQMYYDFGIKLICTILLHMIIRPDLKQAVELVEYLSNPTQMEHVNSSRLLCATMLLVKFSVGILCETLFILTISSYKEGEDANIQRILMTFVIFLVIYEAPLFIFKVKQGNNQLRYFEQLSIYNEVRREQIYINKGSGIDMQRACDSDLGVGAIHLVINSIYSIVFVYTFFYLLFLLQIANLIK